MIQSSHWYDKEGNAVFEVPNKSAGGMRKTTIADAKKLGLYPSVTTVLGVIAKPELDRWKQQQVLLASLALPRKEGETEESFCDRVIEDAFQQVGDAADLGTRVHAALEAHFQGERYDAELAVYVEAVDKWVAENQIEFTAHELRLVDQHLGYAGTTDALIKEPSRIGIGVLDFKTRKSKPELPMKPWKTEPMQLSAYGRIKHCTFAVNLFISTTEPGRIEASWYDLERMSVEFQAFKNALSLWQHLNSFSRPPTVQWYKGVDSTGK